jgi:hypothetical protein
METIYLTVSEQGRVRGRISGTVLRIDNNGSTIIGTLEIPIYSNQGLESETVKLLVDKKELPKEALDKSDYINYDYKEGKYRLILIEGKGLNYYSIK